MTNTLETGGSERQFTALAGALRPQSFRVRLGCLGRKGAFLKGIEDIAEFDLGGSFFNFQAQRARIALARHLRAHGAAVAHSFDFYSNLMLIPTARLTGVPVVVGSQRQLGDLLSPLQRAVQRAAFRLCDRVVCNSKAAANLLSDQGLSKHKLVIIPNGLPNAAFTERPPALPRIPGVLRVGLIARMNDPAKNHAAFLRVAARLSSRFPQVEYLLVGDGDLRPALEQMTRELGLGSRVRFLGERHDIAEVLASLDVSVVTSLSESLSNVILESMAAGKPVIASDVGGNPELVRDAQTGLLVPPNEEEKLADSLTSLLTKPSLREQLGRKAQSVARAEFGLDKIRDQYEQLYTDMLAEKHWRPRPRRTASDGTRALPRRLRVAIVAPSSRWIGGQGVQANLLLRSWQDDPDVEARLIPIDPQLPRWIAWVEAIPYLRTVIREPFYVTKLWQEIKTAEIVHIFSASYWSFLLAPVPACVVAKLRGKKTLINYRSGEARDHLRRWRTALPVLRRANALVVPSQYLVDVFNGFGLKALAVPNMVDPNQFSYRPRNPLRPLLVCTRGFESYYRVDLVVRAFAQIKKEFPDARLCLAGRGGLEPAIRALVRELELKGVEFAGALSREEIGKVYDRADIFMNASWLDNMPVSILEAFASGTPVVSTAPEGIRYFVEHERTALLCAPGDVQTLAENVIRLLRNPELALHLAENAHKESQRYRWETVRGQWLQIYRSLSGRQESLESSEASRHVTPISV